MKHQIHMLRPSSQLLLLIVLFSCTHIKNGMGFINPCGVFIATTSSTTGRGRNSSSSSCSSNDHRTRHGYYYYTPSSSTAVASDFRRKSPRTQLGGFLHRPTQTRQSSFSTTALNLQYIPSLHLDITPVEAETLAGPFFGLSLFPYLAFLYLLNVPQNDTPKGVTVGFAACLVFVFLTIPAAIAAQVLYGVSLADSDWLHGSAESLLTMTNLVTVVAFRQALQGKERQGVDDVLKYDEYSTSSSGVGVGVSEQESNGSTQGMPLSATSYQPMVKLVGILTVLAALTALIPAAVSNPEVHTLYLNGFMDLPKDIVTLLFGQHPEPPNALSIACWIIHISSLVEFLVAMGFAWRWADVVGNPKWKGLTWGLLPLHSSGITACTYHLFYNHIPILVSLQAVLTCVGNTTAAYAAWRIAISNGWRAPEPFSFLNGPTDDSSVVVAGGIMDRSRTEQVGVKESGELDSTMTNRRIEDTGSSSFLVGFEDLGDALSQDNDYTFLLKLFVGCGIAAYAIKYGELLLDFPFVANPYTGLAFVFVPSALNAFKWYKRSKDPTFEGWF